MPVDKAKKKLRSVGERSPEEDDKPKTRHQQTLDRGGTPLFPEAGDLEYLLGHLRDAGIATAGDMGMSPLSPEALTAWQNGTQTPLCGCEFQILLDLSREYVGFLRKAEDPACEPPYGESADIDRQKVATGLQAALRGRMKRETQ